MRTMLEIEALDEGFYIRMKGAGPIWKEAADDKYSAARIVLAWLGFDYDATQRALVVLGNEQNKPVEDKCFDLLDYLMNKPYGVMGWVDLRAAFPPEICLLARIDGLVAPLKFCENEACQITRAGIETWRVGREFLMPRGRPFDASTQRCR